MRPESLKPQRSRHVIEDAANVTRMFEAVGFEKAGVVKKRVKDQNGQERNLAILVHGVTSLARSLEDGIQDSVVPAFRWLGEGVE